MDDESNTMISEMQQALRELRERNHVMITALKNIKHKCESVVRHGAIDKQLQIDAVGVMARDALNTVGALEKVI